jgi:DNA topoisomerase-1
MAKKKKSTSSRRHRGEASEPFPDGKHLVIVESPAKAKTIKRYLGPDYEVKASVGHIRDLPSKNPKGVKDPVPGVDLEHDFQPTYEVLPGKKKTVSELKQAAKKASDIWFATDLDREGEAIAWHLAQLLDVEPSQAKRVIFNAVTKSEIQRAFTRPHAIDEYKVNAQQARRILDRIVGYQVSPLLWRKVSRGLSAGRVQSVAVRLIVERERAIRAFVPDEYWRVVARLALDPSLAASLGEDWREFMSRTDEKGKQPTQRAQNAWLAEHDSIRAELVELNGEKFELGTTADEQKDLSARVKEVASAVGLRNVKVHVEEDAAGKGPARFLKHVEGQLDPATRYRVQSIETKRTTSRAGAPFITSTLQMAASSALGMGAQRAMRIAQALYEGVNIPGEGLVGLITYMRTDSTHLSPEAIDQARTYIRKTFDKRYLPDGPNYFGSAASAQEAHEAIRPTDVTRTPDSVERALSPEQAKVYRLIWNRFVGSQMAPAEWDSTSVLFERSDEKTGAILRATGRVLVFDGHYRVTGVPTAADEQTLPSLREEQVTAPFSIDPEQLFTSPPPRYTEASLVKELESEGIGRPSTYAAIIEVIQDRKYVEQIDRRFFATDLGEVVTDKLIEAFPSLMDIGYTREMEGELDKIEDAHTDWTTMLRRFYKPFVKQLEEAHETMTHAKAETQPAIYQCPDCGSRTVYRFGKAGRFLSCSAYPKCHYAAPINREGRPMLPERVNVACPDDGSPMELRTGRFGPFLASVNYPEVKCIVNLDRKGRIKYPAPPPLTTDIPCPVCGAPLNLREGKRGPWLGCSTFPKCRGRLAWNKVEEAKRAPLEKALAAHLKENPVTPIRTLKGDIIPDGTPIADLMLQSSMAELKIHPDARVEAEAA